MSKLTILDNPTGYGIAWNALSLGDRRRITRAVTKGLEMEDGVEAELLVMTARRQISFWRWAWLIGPAVTMLQWGKELAVFLAAIVLSTIATGMVAWFFVRRARRAEAVNIERATRSARKGAPHPKSRQAQAQAPVPRPKRRPFG